MMMKPKKRYIIISAAVLLVIALFPFGEHLRDGGTVIYEPVTKIYRIDKMHALTGIYGEYYVGTVIYIFGQEVYNDTRIADER